MIAKLSSISRVTEVDAASRRMLGAYKTTNLITDPHLSRMFTDLEGRSPALTAAINQSKADGQLEKFDENRDQPLRSLSYLVEGYLHYPDPALVEAAETVDHVFGKYGLRVTDESYATESSLIASLLDDLSKPKLQDAIALLPGCADIITSLQTAQQAFETARIAYEQEKAEESTRMNATALKAKVLEIINDKIVVYLRAMEVVDEANYGAFARTISTIIDANNETVKKRGKKTYEPMEK
jgi:hypothetical protein